MRRLGVLGLLTMLLFVGCSTPPHTEEGNAFQGCGPTVVVHSGDTLSEIAQRCGVALHALARANGIDPPYMIRIGQVLDIPSAQSTAMRASAQPTSSGAHLQRRLVWPLPGATVVWKQDSRGGAGMLLHSPAGEPVRTMAPGRVVTLTHLPDYGPVVVIDHGKGLYGVYAHLLEVNVLVGQHVEAGAPLGICAPDQSGESACYVELRKQKRLLDVRHWRHWSGR